MEKNNALNGQPGSLETKSLSNKHLNIPGEDLSRTTPSPKAKEKEGVNVAP